MGALDLDSAILWVIVESEQRREIGRELRSEIYTPSSTLEQSNTQRLTPSLWSPLGMTMKSFGTIFSPLSYVKFVFALGPKVAYTGKHTCHGPVWWSIIYTPNNSRIVRKDGLPWHECRMLSLHPPPGQRVPSSAVHPAIVTSVTSTQWPLLHSICNVCYNLITYIRLYLSLELLSASKYYVGLDVSQVGDGGSSTHLLYIWISAF